MTLEEVFNAIERTKEPAIARLKELVRIPSVSAEGKGVECADALITLLKKEIGFTTRKISTSGSPVVYAEKNVGAPTTLLFYNHYDVQPVDPLSDWQSPPFKAVLRDGKLYGRGVSDNKGNIVARIFAIKAYQSIFGALPLNLKFVIEGQEEIGSPYLHEFVEKYPELAQADFCIWEDGHRDADGNQQIWLGVKGILYLNLAITTAKRDIHSSWGGVVENPAWDLVWLLNSLKTPDQKILIDGYYDTVQEPTAAELENLEAIPFNTKAYYEDFGIQQFLQTGRDLKTAYYYAPSLTIDGLTCGYQGPGDKTIIPAEAKAKIDFRLVPNQEPDDLLEKFKSHLQKHHFDNVKIISHHGYPPARVPLSSQYLRVIGETGEQIYGHPLVVHPTSAGSGPMYLFKMDCFSFGCGNAFEQVHAPNENILLEDLVLNMKHLAAIVHAFTPD